MHTCNQLQALYWPWRGITALHSPNTHLDPPDCRDHDTKYTRLVPNSLSAHLNTLTDAFHAQSARRKAAHGVSTMNTANWRYTPPADRTGENLHRCEHSDAFMRLRRRSPRLKHHLQSSLTTAHKHTLCLACHHPFNI